GAITNVSSALVMDPTLKERITVVWLGGHSIHFAHNKEFNLRQDVAGARVLFGCGVPLVILPCAEVVRAFTLSGPELEYWLAGKNPLADYLAKNTIREAESYAKGTAWTRPIWDVTAVAWLLNDKDRFMTSYLIPAPIPEYDHHYAFDYTRHMIRYVNWIHRDALMTDMLTKLAK
ncbi:MAG: nucleoside hydrolase, partial [Clostridia bacterium]|nr:nucleoside hydrolase [Clostridia bacterium]